MLIRSNFVLFFFEMRHPCASHMADHQVDTDKGVKTSLLPLSWIESCESTID
jgi:hypothetical protein